MSEEVHPEDWEWFDELLDNLDGRFEPDGVRVRGRYDEIQLVYRISGHEIHPEESDE